MFNVSDQEARRQVQEDKDMNLFLELLAAQGGTEGVIDQLIHPLDFINLVLLQFCSPLDNSIAFPCLLFRKFGTLPLKLLPCCSDTMLVLFIFPLSSFL